MKINKEDLNLSLAENWQLKQTWKDPCGFVSRQRPLAGVLGIRYTIRYTPSDGQVATPI